MPCERWSLIRYFYMSLLLKTCTSLKSACIGLHVKLLLPRTGFRLPTLCISRAVRTHSTWWDNSREHVVRPFALHLLRSASTPGGSVAYSGC